MNLDEKVLLKQKMRFIFPNVNDFVNKPISKQAN